MNIVCVDVVWIATVLSFAHDPSPLPLDLSPAIPTQPVAEKTILLTYFYKHCMHRLTAPLMANTTEERISKGTPLW